MKCTFAYHGKKISSHSADEMYNKKSQIKIFHRIQEMKCM